MDLINEFNKKMDFIIDLYSKNKLEQELKKLPTKLLSSLDEIIKTKSFISGSDVITILTELNYDPDDIIYVFSRDDRASRFWTQKRKDIYLNDLEEKTKKYNNFNQKRIRIFNNYELMKDDDIFYRLKNLHNKKTYFSLPSSELNKYSYLNDLIFGVSISTKYRYAIIPIPSHISIGIQSIGIENISNVGKILALYKDYDIENGPLKAIITIDSNYITNLIKEFKNALKNPLINLIK